MKNKYLVGLIIALVVLAGGYVIFGGRTNLFKGDIGSLLGGQCQSVDGCTDDACHQGKINQLTTDAANLQVGIDKLNERLDNANAALPIANKNNEDALSAYTTANNKVTDYDNKLQQAQSDLQTADNSRKTLDSNRVALEKSMNDAKAAKAAALTAKDNASAAKAAAKTAKDKALIAKNTAEAAFNRTSLRIPAAWKKAQDTFNKAVIAYNNAVTAYNKAAKTYDNAVAVLTAKSTAYTTALNAYNANTPIYVRASAAANTAYNNASRKVDDLTLQLSQAKSDRDAKKDLVNQMTNALEMANAEIATTKESLAHKQALLDAKNAEITSVEKSWDGFKKCIGLVDISQCRIFATWEREGTVTRNFSQGPHAPYSDYLNCKLVYPNMSNWPSMEACQYFNNFRKQNPVAFSENLLGGEEAPWQGRWQSCLEEFPSILAWPDVAVCLNMHIAAVTDSVNFSNDLASDAGKNNAWNSCQEEYPNMETWPIDGILCTQYRNWELEGTLTDSISRGEGNFAAYLACKEAYPDVMSTPPTLEACQQLNTTITTQQSILGSQALMFSLCYQIYPETMASSVNYTWLVCQQGTSWNGTNCVPWDQPQWQSTPTQCAPGATGVPPNCIGGTMGGSPNQPQMQCESQPGYTFREFDVGQICCPPNTFAIKDPNGILGCVPLSGFGPPPGQGSDMNGPSGQMQPIPEMQQTPPPVQTGVVVCPNGFVLNIDERGFPQCVQTQSATQQANVVEGVEVIPVQESSTEAAPVPVQEDSAQETVPSGISTQQ